MRAGDDLRGDGEGRLLFSAISEDAKARLVFSCAGPSWLGAGVQGAVREPGAPVDHGAGSVASEPVADVFVRGQPGRFRHVGRRLLPGGLIDGVTAP